MKKSNPEAAEKVAQEKVCIILKKKCRKHFIAVNIPVPFHSGRK